MSLKQAETWLIDQLGMAIGSTIGACVLAVAYTVFWRQRRRSRREGGGR